VRIFIARGHRGGARAGVARAASRSPPDHKPAGDERLSVSVAPQLGTLTYAQLAAAHDGGPFRYRDRMAVDLTVTVLPGAIHGPVGGPKSS